MATTKADIAGWLAEAQRDPRNTHVAIVCDTYDNLLALVAAAANAWALGALHGN